MMRSVVGMILTGEHQSTREACSSATLFPYLDRLGIKHDPPRRDSLDQVPTPWHGHCHCYQL